MALKIFLNTLRSFFHCGRFIALTLLIIFLTGCSTPKSKDHIPTPGSISQLENQYAKSFVSLRAPSESEIKKEGRKVTGIRRTFDDIWEAMLIVGMQQAPVVKILKEKGILVVPPLTYFANREVGGRVVLYAYLMKDLYAEVNNPSKYFVKIHPDDSERILRTALGQIVSQLQADAKLNSDGQWSYLKPGE